MHSSVLEAGLLVIRLGQRWHEGIDLACAPEMGPCLYGWKRLQDVLPTIFRFEDIAFFALLRWFSCGRRLPTWSTTGRGRWRG
eukprot:8816228-Pyramimonas_sp.AAC.1